MSIHQQVNELRGAQRLKPLTLNSIISVQAKEHSIDLARKWVTHHLVQTGRFELKRPIRLTPQIHKDLAKPNRSK